MCGSQMNRHRLLRTRRSYSESYCHDPAIYSGRRVRCICEHLCTYFSYFGQSERRIAAQRPLERPLEGVRGATSSRDMNRSFVHFLCDEHLCLSISRGHCAVCAESTVATFATLRQTRVQKWRHRLMSSCAFTVCTALTAICGGKQLACRLIGSDKMQSWGRDVLTARSL